MYDGICQIYQLWNLGWKQGQILVGLTPGDIKKIERPFLWAFFLIRSSIIKLLFLATGGISKLTIDQKPKQLVKLRLDSFVASLFSNISIDLAAPQRLF